MARAAQGDRARRQARGRPAGSWPSPAGSDNGPSSRPWRRRSGVELNPIDRRDAGEIERDVAAFARAPNSGLIVAVSASALVHRELIITLAARHRLPAVYPYRTFVAGRRPDLLRARRRRASTAARPATSIASSRARSPPTCRCRRRPSTSWRSTSRPPRRSASPCRRPLLARADEVIE